MKKERRRNRLAGFDYSIDNRYFITSCIKGRHHSFGKVIDGEMVLNEFGKIAHAQFLWLQNQYPYVILHEFIIMPDHVHAIIEISRCANPLNNARVKSLSELVGAYKTTVSKKIHLAGFLSFAWQRSFFDVIIRSDRDHYYIGEYILDNPEKWSKRRA